MSITVLRVSMWLFLAAAIPTLIWGAPAMAAALAAMAVALGAHVRLEAPKPRHQGGPR